MAENFRLSFNCDFTHQLQKTSLSGFYGTGNSNAHTFVISMYNNGTPVMLQNQAITGTFISYSNMMTIPITGGSIVNGKAEITLKSECYQLSGMFAVFVNVGTVTVFAGEGIMSATSTDTYYDPDKVIPSLGELLAQVEAVKIATAEANTATASANSAASKANAAAGRSPYIGENGHWYIWDVASEEFVDSTNPSIPALTFEVQTGAAGSQVQIEQGGTEEAPVIRLTIPRGDTGAVDGVDYYEGAPNALGTASPGTANGLSRGDHVHPMPTAADVGALAANDTAVNSALLGGKNPQHYVTVHNILTNSDWRIKKKIINQRGKTEYTSTSNKNTIDRWKTYGQVYVYDGYIRFANAGMEGTTYLYQHHPVGTFEVGKTYTAACMLRNGTVCVGSGVAVDGTGVTVFQSGNFLLRFHPNRNGETDSFIIGFSTGDQSADIRWAVFCEGEYTADEVKKFVEKRYTEELLECQRWLYVASGYAAWTGYKSSTSYFFMELPTQMAGTPTVSADAISVYSTLNAGRQQSASVSTASHGTHGNKVRVTITTEETVANTQPLTCVTNNLMASCEL